MAVTKIVKCPLCDGARGSWENDAYQSTYFDKCVKCKGTGEIEKDVQDYLKYPEFKDVEEFKAWFAGVIEGMEFDDVLTLANKGNEALFLFRQCNSLKCPYCHSPAKLHKNSSGYYGQCSIPQCRAATPYRPSEQGIVDLWGV